MARATISPAGNDFLWNLDGNVGRNSPNTLEDVELVRYGYKCLAKHNEVPAGIKPLIAQMKGSGPYGADLQAVIDRHEADRGGPKDGHVSKVPANAVKNSGATPKYDDKHTYILGTLNNHMRLLGKDTYPRIDAAIESGPAISAKAKSVFQN